MDTNTNGLWVFIETKEDGSAVKVGLELLTPGRGLADKQGGQLAAVVIGYQTAAAAESAGRLGADKIIVVD